MDRFSIDLRNLPRYFYRVKYPNTASPYRPGVGFLSGNQSRSIYQELRIPRRLKAYIQRAFNPLSTSASPFIMVYSDRKTAEDRAMAWISTRCQYADMAKIDTSRLGNTKVLSLQTVMDRLEISTPDRAATDAYYADVYLCVAKIPEESVVEWERPVRMTLDPPWGEGEEDEVANSERGDFAPQGGTRDMVLLTIPNPRS